MHDAAARPRFARLPLVMPLAGPALLAAGVATASPLPLAGPTFATTSSIPPSVLRGDVEGEATAELRAVSAEDYGRFESLGFRATLSPEGDWLAYSVRTVEGDAALHLRSVEAGVEVVIPRGGAPAFSEDGRRFACVVRPEEQDGGRGGPRRGGNGNGNGDDEPHLEIRDLVEGGTTTMPSVARFAFAPGGDAIAIQRLGGGQDGGSDLVVHDFTSGSRVTFGSVRSWSWADEAAVLAMTIDGERDGADGVQLWYPADGRLVSLDSGDGDYAGLTWRRDADDLAVMRERSFEDDEDSTYDVLAWRDLAEASATPKTIELVHVEREDVTDDLRIVTRGGLSWTDDGAALLFGMRDWENRPEAVPASGEDEAADDEADDNDGDGDGEPRRRGRRGSGDGDGNGDEERETLRDSLDDPAGVDVWHSRDVEIIPLQKRMAPRERNRNRDTAWWIDEDRVVVMGDDPEDGVIDLVRPLENARWAVGYDEDPYEEQQRFGPTEYDLHAIDGTTGERTEGPKRVKYLLGGSPDGEHALFVDGADIHSWHLPSGRIASLTDDLEPSFVNEEMTNLTDEKPPYGIGGFVAGGARVLLHDRWDVWSVAVDGTGAERLTEGREERIRHRVTDPRPDGRNRYEAGEPIHVRLYGEDTKRSGYGVIGPDGDVEVIAYADARIAGLERAEDADVYAWRTERFDAPATLFVGGPDLDGEAQTRVNRFVGREFLWGTAELVDYENDRGEAMQAALFLPAGYDRDEDGPVPTIVYIYEKLSQNMHRWSNPSERSPYNAAVYTSEGYAVLMPDITYRAQNPGVSAIECVIPAVQAAVATGIVDEDAVGIMGHSWGAYQSAFLATRTDVFKAAVAGAPLTNMMSMSMSVYWNSGQTNAWIFHESQGRMDRPFWNDVDTYIENSPIFHVDDMNTPLLVAFGTDDGAVDFNQGVEMYNAARLAGRQLVMLVYEGENHSLRREPNQVDYHWRIREWFDHYLRGAEPAKWITEGVPHLERLEELESARTGNGGGPRRR